MVLTNILAVAWTGIGIVGVFFQVWILRRAQEDRQYNRSQGYNEPTMLISRMHVRTAVGRLYVVGGNVMFGVVVIVRDLLVLSGHASAGDQWGMAIGGLVSIHLIVSEAILVWLGYVDLRMRHDLDRSEWWGKHETPGYSSVSQHERRSDE